MRTCSIKPAKFSAQRARGSARNANPQQHAAPAQALRPWRVMHACDTGQMLVPLIEGELAIGMRPALVTPNGLVKPESMPRREDAEASRISLLTAWHDVRHWRKVMFESDPESESDVVHAHCFTAGMAGVRNFPSVVYDVNEWIEDHAGDSEHVWLARSFRVAEQFVLARAAVVVTHCQSMRQAAIDRGASAENVFVIPNAEDEPEPKDRDVPWLQSLAITGSKEIVIYAPDHAIALDGDKLSAASEQILAAFAIVNSEVEHCHLLVDVTPGAEKALREALDVYSLDNVHAVANGDRRNAYASSDVVIVARVPQKGSTTRANPNAVAAFAARRALLAADLPCNRDLSYTGRGCLWYIADDPRDLARRMSFLARNAEFRRALADAGHGYYLETRLAVAVAQQYDAVYRHAFARRKSGGQTPNMRLLPIQAAL